jgi:hypothetical protein
MAAPVIWLGFWLVSLMAYSGFAAPGGLFVFGSGNKKGPKRPHAHRLNLDGRQPSPAVRLGTTTIRSLVIILRIAPAILPKGCANHIDVRPDVKGLQPIWCVHATLAAFRPFGEREFAATAIKASHGALILARHHA